MAYVPVVLVIATGLPLLAFLTFKLVRLLLTDQNNAIAHTFAAKAAYRFIGLLNLALCGWGASLMFRMVRFVPGGAEWHNWYFQISFVVVEVINFLLMTVLVITAVKLIRLTNNAVLSYCASVMVVVVYGFLEGGLWLAPDPIGRSIAGATGVGNMGTAPFVFLIPFPYVYPIISALVLFTIRMRLLRVIPQVA